MSTAANYCRSHDYPYAMLIEPRNGDIVTALNTFLYSIKQKPGNGSFYVMDYLKMKIIT